jgi:predicted dithiol-disulfide oxidoreductase (DUF899 family)
MDRNQSKKLLPIIQAYAEGKTIQSRCIKGDTSLWYDDEDPSFDDDFEYRIKPDSKPESKTDVNYRPFANAEECWKEMLEHQPFGWVKDKKDGHHALITAVDDDTCGMSLNGNAAWSLSGIMDLFTFADGTPFGVKVEE